MRGGDVQIVGKVLEMQKWAFNPLTRPAPSCILVLVAPRHAGFGPTRYTSRPTATEKKVLKTVSVFPRNRVYGC